MSERDKRRVDGAVKLARTVTEDATMLMNPILGYITKFTFKRLFGYQKKTLEIFSSVFLVEDVNTFPNHYSHNHAAQNH